MDKSVEVARLASALAHPDGGDATAVQIAESVHSAFEAIGAALTPIIGQRGFAALQMRSLHLASRAHPWLEAGINDGQPTELGGHLTSVIKAQSSEDAARGGAAVLQSFHELLATLVGPSLTERLLRTVWIQFLNVSPLQDSPP